MDKVFAQLTGLGARALKSLMQSPFTMHEGMVELIRAEARAPGRQARAHHGQDELAAGRADHRRAVQGQPAGVKIDLIVRGVRAGVPGLSENIRVRSIVGRFLEHSRVFYFYADGDEIVYLSSADWMDRNFFRRVEIAFPIYDKTLKKRVIDEAFTYALRDNQLSGSNCPTAITSG